MISRISTAAAAGQSSSSSSQQLAFALSNPARDEASPKSAPAASSASFVLPASTPAIAPITASAATISDQDSSAGALPRTPALQTTASDLSQSAPLDVPWFTPLDTPLDSAREPVNQVETTLIFKAQPDDVFAGVGEPYPPLEYDENGQPLIPRGSKLKTNQAYPWGMATTEDRYIWTGTGANVQSLYLSVFLGVSTPIQTPAQVLEFSQSQWAKTGLIHPKLGDWRPPQIYRTDTLTGETINLTPVVSFRLYETLGMRSFSLSPDGSFLLTGGPNNAVPSTAINLFAFDAQTGEFLGDATLPGYSNIRKFTITSDGSWYAGVKTEPDGGAILRFTGDRMNPFAYEVVGTTDGEVGELTEHQGYLFVSTAPNESFTDGVNLGRVSGVFRSPAPTTSAPLPPSTAPWTPVLRVDQYEPDPVTKYTYGFGALASFDGQLVVGTTSYALAAGVANQQVYKKGGGLSTLFLSSTLTNRAVALFAIDDAATSQPEVSLLYGDPKLWTWVGQVGSPRGAWVQLDNRLRQSPRFGPSGFGNFYNIYTWNMTVFDGKLYLGTFDYSVLLSDMLLQRYSAPYAEALPLGNYYGADLFAFDSLEQPARLLSDDGLGNLFNYGIRNTVILDGKLYLGMANPFNVANEDGHRGGFEILRVDHLDDDATSRESAAV